MSAEKQTILTVAPAPGQGIAMPPVAFSADSSRVRRSATSTARLLKASIILAVMLVLYNAVILAMARHSQRRALVARLAQIPAQTDCVFLGNSLVEAGCDVDAFNAAWPDARRRLAPINLALGATSPVEHFLILKRALALGPPVKCIIYGFFDDQLNTNPRGDFADLVGNRALSYYFPADAAALYAPGSLLKEWEMRVLSHVPMVSERSSLWGKVELVREALSDIGMPKSKMNRFGRVSDFSALEMKDAESFNLRCQALLQGQAEFSRPIEAMIRLARQYGATFIFVEMPMPSRHRNTFYNSPDWARLRSRLQDLAAQDHALYVTASDWIGDDSRFEDATHLSEEGAKVFSAALASKLSAMNLLPASGLTQAAASVR